MNKLLSSIHDSSKIAMISHIHPDGDSLGAILGLGLALQQICRNVHFYVNDEIPGKYRFLPGIEKLKKYDPENTFLYDWCIVLDCADQNRLGNGQRLLEHSKKIVNIDHHPSNTLFGHINMIDEKASSTCEIIYTFLKTNSKIRLDKAIATCLFTGIITDSGRYIYDNTSSDTHRAAAELMDLGIHLQEIVYHLYQNKSMNSVKLLGYVLNHLEFLHEGKVAMFCISSNLLKEFDIDYGEIDGMIDFARDIEGVEVAIVFKVMGEEEVKVSFRSKNNVDVNLLAREFNGGGHKKASGATIKGSLQEVRKKVEEKLQNFII